MDPITIGFIGVGALVLLVVIGLPVAFAAAIVGIGGLMVMRNVDTAIGLAGIVPYASSASYSLSVMPLFIAIGFLALHAGITRGAFESARLWVGRLPGGLATATAAGAALWWLTPFAPEQAVLMALVVTVMGSFGGLVMSAIKRDKGVKDWGHLIAGHGGFLDRLDSVVFAAPIFFHLTRYFWSQT